MRIHMVLAVAIVAMANPAKAEVKAVSPAGFQVTGQTTIAKPRQAVWDAMLKPNDWWSPQHRWFEGSTLSLDARPGGCWCESGPDGAGAMHMQVGLIDPNKTLQLVGALGPLQAMGLTGVLTITLKDVERGAQVDWSYTVTGWQPQGIAFMAAPVDGVLAEQMERLKATAEGSSHR